MCPCLLENQNYLSMSVCSVIQILFLMLLFTSSCKEVNDEFSHLTRVEVRFMREDTSTPFGIDCDGFEQAFREIYNTKIISGKSEIDQIKRSLRQSKNINGVSGIDTRVKVYIYSGENISHILCFDKFGNLILNSSEYIDNKDFVDLINNKIHH